MVFDMGDFHDSLRGFAGYDVAVSSDDVAVIGFWKGQKQVFDDVGVIVSHSERRERGNFESKHFSSVGCYVYIRQ